MPPRPTRVVSRLLQARYGWEDLPENVLQDLGKQTIKMELEFNRRAGFTAKDDRIPAWMTREKLPPHNSVFDVPDETLDNIFEGYVRNAGRTHAVLPTDLSHRRDLNP